LSCKNEQEAWWLTREILDLLRLHELELQEVCPDCANRDEFWRIVRSSCPPTVTVVMGIRQQVSPGQEVETRWLPAIGTAADDRFKLN